MLYDKFLISLAANDTMVSAMSTISSRDGMTSNDEAINTEKTGGTATYLSEISKIESITGTKCNLANLAIFWLLSVNTYFLLEYTNAPVTAETTSMQEAATLNEDGKTISINLSHSNGYAKGGYLI